MKNFRLLIISLLLACTTAAAVAAPTRTDTLRVLAIGNSFTVDACSQDLYGFFEAAGQPVIIGYVTKGGSCFEQHMRWAKSDSAAFVYNKIVEGHNKAGKGATLSQALKDEPWDIVTFQQQSAKSAIRESIDPYLGQLVKYVRKRVPKGVRMMYYQTWAYEHESTIKQFEQFNKDEKAMYDAIMEVSREFSAKYKMDIIPAGTAVQNLRSSFNMNNDIRKGDHMNVTIGRYTVAATWYEAITGDNVQGNTYAPYTLPNHVRREMAQKCAHAANLLPFEVTSMRTEGGSYNSVEAGPFNHDEALVPQYTLPDPLVMNDGTPVTTTEQWINERRPELLELFSREVYGRAPGRLDGQHYKLLSTDDNVFGGLATRMEVAIYFNENEDKYIDLLVYLPNNVEGPVPAFLAMNLAGNTSIHKDEGIAEPTEMQLENYEIYGIPARGQKQHRFPLEMILDRGYAFVTYFKSDIDPDFDDGYRNGVHPFIYRPGQHFPDPDQWGSISAWAWGMSRVMDYLETQDRIDCHRVAAIGHSRGGKTALWAGAQDERIAMVISNCSGCTGAAIARRKKGQTVRAICTTFPHWFCFNYLKYMDNEDALPVDQHELIALIAPRPVYVASATLDRGADPKGEFLGEVGAMPVYNLFGYEGLPTTEWPEPRHPLSGDRMGYHLRDGHHDVTAYDWKNYLNFADKHFK